MGGSMTAPRTRREGLTWVSDRDVEIKLPVTLHRRRRPPKRPSRAGFQILAVSAVASSAAGRRWRRCHLVFMNVCCLRTLAALLPLFQQNYKQANPLKLAAKTRRMEPQTDKSARVASHASSR